METWNNEKLQAPAPRVWTSNFISGGWHVNGNDKLHRLRSDCVVLIERMLRNHQPHNVLSCVPKNADWKSKTFTLALKIERLIFEASASWTDYLDEKTLHRRVKVVCHYLVRMRMRKKATMEVISDPPFISKQNPKYTLLGITLVNDLFPCNMETWNNEKLRAPAPRVWTSNFISSGWHVKGNDKLHRLRSDCVVLIERMLRNHQPHNVLSRVPKNADWKSKTFTLALKIERLIFEASASWNDYLDEKTLQRRVKVVCHYLVRMRMCKKDTVEVII